jgi:mannosyltransferase OCH1-like enzyme
MESQIPLKIFCTWHTKELPPFMKQNFEILKSNNDEFEVILYDNDDCLDFLQKNFPEGIANAYIALKPGAYKADLWRLCILYKYGGIYSDIKIRSVNDFKLIELTDKEYFVDFGIYYDEINKKKYRYVDNGFMVCKPQNPILLECINLIVENVKNKYYGFTPFDITGPTLLGKMCEKYNAPLFISHTKEANSKDIFIKDNKIILEFYPEYREEQKNTGKTAHYSELWKQKDVFN